jgi:hypothetical protein
LGQRPGGAGNLGKSTAAGARLTSLQSHRGHGEKLDVFFSASSVLLTVSLLGFLRRIFYAAFAVNS